MFKRFKRFHFAALASMAIISGLGVPAVHADEQEVKVTLDQLPAAVKATLIREADGQKIETVDKQGDGDKAVYEVDVKLDGANYEIKVGADGKLISKKIDKGD